jgi:hypothetical protein
MRRLFILLLLACFFGTGFSQDVESTQINKAFKAGNTTVIAKYFNANVEITVLSKNGIYSKIQAKNILNAFFSDKKITDFHLIHSGGKKESFYYVSKLSTDSTDYRIFYLLKPAGGTYAIYQLTIEKQQ